MQFRPAILSLAMIATPICFAGSALSGDAAVGNQAVHVQFSTTPHGGFNRMTWTMRVLALPDPSAGYFFAAEFYYEHQPPDGGTGYIGIQPHGNAISGPPRKLALFSVFGNGTSAITQSFCEEGADGGPGTSCRKPYDWSVNRTYLFDVHLVARSPDKETWAGSVTDVATASTAEIASWTVPASWGMLSNGALTWVEYFAHPPSCSAQPYMQALFNAPTDYIGSRAYATQAIAHDFGSLCQSNSKITVAENARSAVLESGIARKP